ncbi:MAG: IclR family transcriptional regulator [Alicyclobacillus sp.]|nr:IclR family transcriptional regulator [Alicyclobacillus sp.]
MATHEPSSAHASVRAVDRALDILLCFAHSGNGLTLSDIAREVNLHKSTVHRLLMSLQQKGFVRKRPDSDRYMIGWRILELFGTIHQSDELVSSLLPSMTHLRDITGETVSLYVRSGTERVRIQSVESNQPVRNVAIIGQTYPLYIGASGKVLLAYAPDAVVEQVLADPNLPPGFQKDDFYRQLAAIRKEGYAISIQERDEGAAAIAVPILNRNQEVILAISVSGPVSRFTPEKMQEHVPVVLRIAAIMNRLGAY